MSRQFTLAGLLRLRHMQEDQAAATLAAANRRHSSSSSRRAAARAELGDSDAEVSTAAGLQGMAAARAASQSMLADLHTMVQLDESQAQEAREAFKAARINSKGLEKLQEKHAADVAEADLAAEQVAVDEMASGSWHRERMEPAV